MKLARLERVQVSNGLLTDQPHLSGPTCAFGGGALAAGLVCRLRCLGSVIPGHEVLQPLDPLVGDTAEDPSQPEPHRV